MKILHELLWISEKEMRELENDPGVKRPDRPTRFYVTAAGTIKTWPQFDPKKHVLFFKEK